MWLFTNFGFFSIVRKPEDESAGTLTVRSRVKSDLEALRDKYLPKMGSITANAGSDYRYRAKAPREAVAEAMLQAVRDLDYSNFKDSVAKNQGHDRTHLYHKVWDVLYALQKKQFAAPPPPPPPDKPAAGGKAPAYGGVIIDGERRVLLRKPRN